MKTVLLHSLLSSCLLTEIGALQTLGMTSSSKNSAFVRSHHRWTASSSVYSTRSSLVMYDDSTSKSSSDSSTSKTDIVWTTLSNTEKWIQKTLGLGGDSNGSSPSSNSKKSNPYTRKEVAYVCETSDTLEEIVSGLFRRLREMREVGAGHGQAEEELRKNQPASYIPHTFRQTLVVVAPSCEILTTSFPVFDNLILTINEARRNARDYVTDFALDKDWTQEWITSVNLAHLHPEYGTYVQGEAANKSDVSKADAAAPVDPSTKYYAEARVLARRSPYPSMVIEVKSTPPFSNNESGPQPKKPAAPVRTPDSDPTVSMEDLKKLEALFGLKAALNTSDDDKEMEQQQKTSATNEDDMWDALSRSKGIQQITFMSPADIGQEWIIENDRLYDADSSYFTSFDTMHVDAAYEFIFATIAMQRNRAKAAASSSGGSNNNKAGDIALKRDYLIFPNFLSKAATSFEKFSGQVQKIINAIPGISDVLCVSTFHPEHVDQAKRSPVPILVLEAVHML